MADLSERAMLTRFSGRQWSASKMDRKVSKEVADQYGLKMNAGRWHKILMDTQKIGEYNGIVMKAREHFKVITLPWFDGGIRIIPSKFFMEFSSDMSEYKRDAKRIAKRIEDDWDYELTKAAVRLGPTYNASDYPEKDTVAARYSLNVEFMPIPSAQDFRVQGLGAEEAEIRANVTATLEGAHQTAMNDLWRRLHEQVNGIYEVLNSPGKKFRNSLISKAMETADLLPKLNVLDDPTFAKLAVEMKLKLASLDPAALREDYTYRRNASNDAADILDKMANAGYAPDKAA